MSLFDSIDGILGQSNESSIDVSAKAGTIGDFIGGNDPTTTIVPPPANTANKEQWNLKMVKLLDGDFRYWEAKSGSSIFVDTTNLDNVNLLTPAIAQKLFPK